MERVRVGVIGCGNVSEWYLRDLVKSPFVEMVSVADALPERAKLRAEQFHVPNAYGGMDEMLAGAKFDLLVNLTAMQRHYAVNKQALEAGIAVWTEKPMGTTREQGRELLALSKAKNAPLYGAPVVVMSPAFECLQEIIHSGEIGKTVAAHGSYGHSGPDWGPWFYKSGAGSLFDLGVYNIAFLTALLGPARSVMAMTGTAIPERIIEGEHVKVEIDDNTFVLLDHGDAVFSCIQTGFTYADRESKTGEPVTTVDFTATGGAAKLLGHDWEPHGVLVQSPKTNGWEVRCQDQKGYSWERGGSYIAESLATGKPSRLTAEHAYHVLDVMISAHESAAEGRRIIIL